MESIRHEEAREAEKRDAGSEPARWQRCRPNPALIQVERSGMLLHRLHCSTGAER
jgi:hypothetical protein